MTHEIDKCIDEARKWSVLVDALLGEFLTEQLAHVHIQKRHRVKTKVSLQEKIEDRLQKNSAYTLADVTDVVGFRFVCHFHHEVVEVCDHLLAMILKKNNFEELSEARIYVSMHPNQQVLLEQLKKIFSTHNAKIVPEVKKSSYTSVHLVVQRKKGQKFEIQIRNVFEDAWAEIEHALKYKSKSDHLPQAADRHLVVLNSYVQACSAYSESILLDVQGDTTPTTGSTVVVELYDDIFELNQLPEALRLVVIKSSQLRREENYQQAYDVLADFISLNGDVLTKPSLSKYYFLMERAINSLKLRKVQAAIDDYFGLIADNPKRALIYFRLADAYRIMQDFQSAIAYLKLASENLHNSENTEDEIRLLKRIPYVLAQTYWRLKQPEKSLEILEEAKNKGEIPLNTEGGDFGFLNSYTYYLLDSAKAKNVLVSQKLLENCYEQFLKFDIMSGLFWNELDTFMMVCFHLKRFDEALRAATLLEDMLKYSNDGDLRIKLKNGQFRNCPIDEIEIVRHNIYRVRTER